MQYACFKDGREGINDDSESEHPKPVTTDELIAMVIEIIAVDSNLTCRMHAEECAASSGTIYGILNQRKVCLICTTQNNRRPRENQY